jgi:hypothetical protein
MNILVKVVSIHCTCIIQTKVTKDNSFPYRVHSDIYMDDPCTSCYTFLNFDWVFNYGKACIQSEMLIIYHA